MKIKAVFLFLLMIPSFSVWSEEIEEIAEIRMSLLQTQKIKIEKFNDPKIPNITCYISSINETALFQTSSPSNSGIHCIKTGKSSETGIHNLEQVFEEEVYTKSLSVGDKALRVNRYYDRASNAVVYVSYSNQTGGGSLKHSITAVSLDDSLFEN